MNEGSPSLVVPNKVDLKSIGWNFLMAAGASLTGLVLMYLPQIDLSALVPVKFQGVVVAVAVPTIYAGIKWVNKWFADNSK